MDTPPLREAVEHECRRLCERYGLSQAYVAEIVGRRRHFLAGYGRPSADKPQQMRLSEKVALFWHGNIPGEAQPDCARELRNLAERLEKNMLTKAHDEVDGKALP